MGKKSSQMKNLSIEKLNEIFKNYTLKESFDHLMELGFKNMSFSTSFGQEDQVITDVIFNNDYPISVFTLDTGRLFEATHRVFDDTQKKYRKTINAYFPDREAVEKLLTEKGAYSFYESVDNRKECCQIRKVNPLQRALKGVDLWITGLRANQSTARNQIQMFGYDNAFGLPKFNPLAHWDLSTVEKYLEQNQVPQNHLHKEGFVSIGCAPCTRAVKEGEDIRSGRWWWEDSKKECGLHLNTKS
jgi:phosphoadenosine phosphosulfate reductase